MEMALTSEGHLLMRWWFIITEAESHMEGDMSYFDNHFGMILFVCIYYMMCNVSCAVCIYSILNGVINSREVRRVKAVGPSRSSGAASRQRSRQGVVEDARL
jgi:hypothetical protein